MSPHDLDPIDQRATAAAADLRQRAAARPRPTFDPTGSVDLEAPAPVPARSGWQRPRQLAAAAAAIVALLAGAVVLASSGDDDPDPAEVTTTEVRPWRPTVLPAGLELAGAGEVTGAEVAEFEIDLGPLVVYGPSLEDPKLGVSWMGEEGADFADAEVLAVVEGREVLAVDTGATMATTVAVAAPGGGWLVLISSQLDAEELAPLAGRAGQVDGVASLDPDLLPDGWRRLGEDPQGLFGATTAVAVRGAAMVASRSTYYAVPGATGVVEEAEPASDGAGGEGAEGEGDEAPDPVLPDQRSITVSSTSAEEISLAAQRVLFDGVEDAEVRGHPALTATVEIDGGAVAELTTLAWFEAPGELVRLTGLGVGRDDLVRAAESIEPIPAGEWRDLVERSQLGVLPGSGDPGGVEIARGAFADGTAWILRDTSGGSSEPTIDLQVALTADSVSGSSGGSSGGTEPPALRSLEVEEIAERRFAAGIVAPDAVAVEVRAADGTVLDRVETTPLEDATSGSWFVLEVAADGVEIVVLDATGAELDASGIADVTGGGPGPDGQTLPTVVEVAPVDPSGPDGSGSGAGRVEATVPDPAGG
jgi:hypothetical protein